MAELVEKADIIVTDRLHVAIMATFLNKEVYMLDNGYGKLSEVYKVSLKDKTNVHLLPDFNLWPKELICAWNKLNSGWRTFKLRIRTIRKQLRHRLKQCFLK